MSRGRRLIARIEVAHGLSNSILVGQGMAATMQGLSVVGILADAVAVDGDHLIERRAVLVENTTDRAQLHPKGRQWSG